jgi:hypothetical protein
MRPRSFYRVFSVYGSADIFEKSNISLASDRICELAIQFGEGKAGTEGEASISSNKAIKLAPPLTFSASTSSHRPM